MELRKILRIDLPKFIQKSENFENEEEVFVPEWFDNNISDTVENIEDYKKLIKVLLRFK
uniref:Uncharacterized protein n=1 Tax=viral metagenome TaxID=1070528 RepID=A0A6C0AFM2_9ZZZZ